jgi:HK97 family phage prohead protease
MGPGLRRDDYDQLFAFRSFSQKGSIRMTTQRAAAPRSTRPLAVLDAHGVFVGYASLFNRRDQAGDIVMPGAFAASLKLRGPQGIRMLFQHNPAEPVGTWIDVEEDEKGLHVRGRLNAKVQRGRELAALLTERGLDGLSIGFKTVLASRDRAKGARLLHRIDLWEISLVTFPMLEGARVTGIKARALAAANRLFSTTPSTLEGVK